MRMCGETAWVGTERKRITGPDEVWPTWGVTMDKALYA